MSIEYTTIGTLLRHPAWIAKVQIDPAHFSIDLCREAFLAMRAVTAKGLTPDAVTVAELMPGEPIAELSALYRDSVSRAENLPAWCEAIRKEARRRDLLGLLHTAIDTARQGKDADAIRARLITRLAAMDESGVSYSHDMDAMLSKAVDYVERAHESFSTGQMVGLPTGIIGLDKATCGLQRSDLTIVGARTSVGKTAFMLSVAVNAAKAGKRVGIISAEMSVEQIALRLVSMVGRIDNQKIRSGDMGDHDFSALTSAMLQAKDLPIVVYDKPACTVADTALQARAWMVTGGLDLLCVDYLTRLSPDVEERNRVREVGKMVSGMKTLARTLDIPVMCLSQINRESVKSASKIPTIADLRDSGEIEQEADNILLLYRDVVFNPDTADPESAEIILAKNRNGPCGKVPCRYVGETMTWMDQAGHWEAAGYRDYRGEAA